MAQIHGLLGISLLSVFFLPQAFAESPPPEVPPAPVAAVEAAKKSVDKVEQKAGEVQEQAEEIEGEVEMTDEELELEFPEEDFPEDLPGEEQNMTEIPQDEPLGE